MITRSSNGRPWTFYALAAFFTLFVLFLYGPMSAIFILSFQGPSGGLTFPMNGVSLHWFGALFAQQRSGYFVGSFSRSIALGVVVGAAQAGIASGVPVTRLLRELQVRLVGLAPPWHSTSLCVQPFAALTAPV